MASKLLNDLSLAMRARKLLIGFDTVKEALEQDKIFLLISASDLSDKTKKELAFLGERYGAKHITIGAAMDELWYLLGKKAGVIGVTDKAFSEKILSSNNLSLKQQEDCQ